MQQTEKIIQSLHSIVKWGKVGSIFLYISGGFAILIGFWLVLPAALGVFLIMMGIHVQKSVKAAEQLIQAPDTPYEDLLEQYAKMMKMQTLFAISSIAAVILSFIAIVLMLILGGLAILQEIPYDVQQYEGEYEQELGDFY
ncbi:hypothetical protein AKG37_07230 [Bacillus australimaris]|uniref:Integral inner membrane protein n=1 Tax=Bacillus australimaris TaxID=1326968 RepID=A0ABD4QLU4_9BACI|nr:hypothetical protein [Bacillus australimaris]KPN13865.1 hypothetical protein AKG37_07230 [Bacillus australimaris]MBR8690050.1 hypothetical protein [Bacillus australimaris]